MPLFSIILPCHNAAAELPVTLAMLTDQSDAHWELICVNDGSTDTTLSVLMAFAARDSRIRVVHQAQAGFAAARAAGVAVAHGPWITFAQIGEVWDARHLASMRAALRDAHGARVLHRVMGGEDDSLFVQTAACTESACIPANAQRRLAMLKGAGEVVHVVGDGAATGQDHAPAALTRTLPETAMLRPVAVQQAAA